MSNEALTDALLSNAALIDGKFIFAWREMLYSVWGLGEGHGWGVSAHDGYQTFAARGESGRAAVLALMADPGPRRECLGGA